MGCTFCWCWRGQKITDVPPWLKKCVVASQCSKKQMLNSHLENERISAKSRPFFSGCLGTHRTHQLHYGKCGLKKLVNKKWKTSEMDHFKTCIDLIHSLWNVLFANKYWFIESWFISVKPFCGKHLQFDCSLSPTVPMVLKALGLLGQSIQRSPKIPQPCIYRYKYKCVHIYIYNIIYIYHNYKYHNIHNII